MSDKLSSEEYKRQLEHKYGERRKADFEKEFPVVEKYFEAVTALLSSTYDIEKVLAVGGTGIVLVGQHKRFQQPIALKINRPNQAMVEHEAQVLPTLSHPNIIRVLDLNDIPVDPTPDQFAKPTYIVEPYISGSMPFFTNDPERKEGTWLHDRIQRLRREMPDTSGILRGDEVGQSAELIRLLLAELAALFSQWVDLLSYLHSKSSSKKTRYVYLDVKPENVLIDEHSHLTSIDYGSAEHLDDEDPTSVQVFFTDMYAHPEMRRRVGHKGSTNRVQGAFKRMDLNPGLDHYALGISMLQILDEVAKETRPHVVPQLPLYRSLHFLATRLLDGRNNGRPSPSRFPYAPEVFPSLKDSDYESIRYEALADTFRDLEKERGRWNLEDKVPELATYSKDIVRVVPGYNTVLTPRLRSVIEHPLVARLKYVTQLGLVSLVYPTADHSRYDHSLGSYTYTTYYVKSLFNDLGSPVFRNLVGEEDVNGALLAALLHDLGQYPLAHDLEEVHEGIFKHGPIGMSLLEDTTRDEHGRTLLEVIEDSEFGWGVPKDVLERIIGAHTKNLLPVGKGKKLETELKTDVLAAIVDGPVDADKADYIIRDSGRCELPYGSQLDMERFLRVLTVAIIPEEADPVRRVTLGVYDKGVASAHAFGFARHLLFSTVYWHHTSRIAKAMLQYATVMGLPTVVFNPGDSPDRREGETKSREQLLDFIKRLVPPFEMPQIGSTQFPARKLSKLDLSAQPPDQVIDLISGDSQPPRAEREGTEGTTWHPGIAWTDWLMLKWISELPESSEQSRNLIDALQGRRLYKRVASFDRGGAYDELIQNLERLPWPKKLSLCKEMHKTIQRELSQRWISVNTRTTMTSSDFERLCDAHLLVLIDVPTPSEKVGFKRPLGIVPELKERSYQQDPRQAMEDRGWREAVTKLMNSIAPVRVLCHPKVRNLVSAAYAPEERSAEKAKSVEKSMAELIQSILPSL